jgi:hypothetical protein
MGMSLVLGFGDGVFSKGGVVGDAGRAKRGVVLIQLDMGRDGRRVAILCRLCCA